MLKNSKSTEVHGSSTKFEKLISVSKPHGHLEPNSSPPKNSDKNYPKEPFFKKQALMFYLYWPKMYKGEVHLQTDRKSPEFSQAIEKLINFK